MAIVIVPFWLDLHPFQFSAFICIIRPIEKLFFIVKIKSMCENLHIIEGKETEL